MTGMVLRALVAHPDYRAAPEALKAADLLKSRFFKPDKYVDRRAATYWKKFQYSFWWPNILNSLDSLSRTGYSRDDEQVQEALDRFIENQVEDGLWVPFYTTGRARPEAVDRPRRLPCVQMVP